MDSKDKLHENHQDNDGIQEYDNPLPDWFVTLFYGCIVFAVIYIGYYSGYGWALTRAGKVSQNLSASGADYLVAVKLAEKSTRTSQPEVLEGNALHEMLKMPASIASGEVLFKANCIACHGAEGQGVVGPNLTDPFWIHGGKPEAILASVSTGYPDKGMPGWKQVLGDAKVRLAVAYVISLQGRQVANPKPPQGEKDP